MTAAPNLEVDLAQAVCFRQFSLVILVEMAPAMKVTKAKKVNTKGQKAMTKGNLMGELANATELKRGYEHTAKGSLRAKHVSLVRTCSEQFLVDHRSGEDLILRKATVMSVYWVMYLTRLMLVI